MRMREVLAGLGCIAQGRRGATMTLVHAIVHVQEPRGGWKGSRARWRRGGGGGEGELTLQFPRCHGERAAPGSSRWAGWNPVRREREPGSGAGWSSELPCSRSRGRLGRRRDHLCARAVEQAHSSCDVLTEAQSYLGCAEEQVANRHSAQRRLRRTCLDTAPATVPNGRRAARRRPPHPYAERAPLLSPLNPPSLLLSRPP